MMKSALSFSMTVLAALAVASAVSAHPKLVSSTPTAGSTVSAPKEVVLRFSEPLLVKFSGASLSMTSMMMDGKMMDMPMEMGAMSVALDPKDSKVLVLKPKTALMIGGYKLDWHAVSTDTHRVAGSLTFKVK